MIKEVFEFNDTILGLAAQNRPLNPLTFKEGEFAFNRKAFDEEIEEMAEGFVAQDVVKMVDAALDLCYFAIGSLRRMGLTVEQAEACFQAIHHANMTKKKGGLAKRGYFEDDAGKPDDFVAPDQAIAHILLEV